MPANAVYEIPAYFMLSYGTGMMLLANPDSHFSLQKPIDIMGDFLQQVLQKNLKFPPSARSEVISPFSKGGLMGICITCKPFKSSGTFPKLPCGSPSLVTRHSDYFT
jgi:hypothetical protein